MKNEYKEGQIAKIGWFDGVHQPENGKYGKNFYIYQKIHVSEA